MLSFLITVIAFMAALGLLVAFHEYGHFWVARRLGVRVLRYSIGFGKPLWRHQRSPDDTEYVVSMLPLGGYVKMLDEREGDVPADQLDQTFNRQPIWKRMAIVAAGPVANVILAVVVYSLVFIVGIPGDKPIVGEVAATSVAAQSGVQSQDLIVAVDNQSVNTWHDARIALLNAAARDHEITLTVDRSGKQQLVLDVAELDLLKEQGDVLAKVGMRAYVPDIPAAVDGVEPDTAAARAGLQAGDVILQTDDLNQPNWREWSGYIRNNPGQSLSVTVDRAGQTKTLALIPESRNIGGEVRGFAGVRPVFPEAEFEALQVIIKYSPLDAVVAGWNKTWDMFSLTVRMIGKLIIGEATLKNISGPLTIAEYAGKTVSVDFSYYLDFIAIISISLAVINLLPIPMLDGGHLLYYSIEAIKGKPLSEKSQMVGQQIGMALLAGLMFIALFNDFDRLIAPLF